ncbi:MAG: choline transporter, partial [Arthrobacter sp.]|nr:choline transporter [Arthrobacter sp.]
MAINTSPEQLPADDNPADNSKAPPSNNKTKDALIAATGNDPDEATLTTETTAISLPGTEETEELLQELRHSEAEQAAGLGTHGSLPLDKTIFGITGVLALAFVIWGFAGRESLATTSQNALNWVMQYTGWLFMGLASLFVIFVLWLALGKFGNIPLGKDGERPEFRTVSWVAMMFAAGMGIGLMFYGVAEPLYHYISPP